MKKFFAVILCLACAAAHSSPARSFTLDDALEQALKSSPDAAAAQARVAEAEAVAMQADSTLYPRLEAALGYSQTDNPMTSFGAILNQGAFNNSINFNDPGRTDAFLAGVYLKYPVFTGGANAARRKAAEEIGGASKYEREAAYANLKAEVVRSFYAVIQASEMSDALGKTITSLEASSKEAAELEKAGKMLKSDRLNIEVQLMSMKEARLSIDHQLKLSKRRFAVVLGIEGTQDIEVLQNPKDAQKFKAPAEDAARPRPEITALQMRVNALESNVDAEFAGYLPSVNLYAGYQYEKGWVTGGDGNSWNAGVVMNVPIFDGMLTRGRVAEAKSKLTQARESLRGLELNLGLEAQRAKLGYELILSKEELTDKRYAQAAESLALSKERFAEGLLLPSDLIRAEANLAEASISKSIIKASKSVAVAEMRRAYGLEIFEGDSANEK